MVGRLLLQAGLLLSIGAAPWLAGPPAGPELPAGDVHEPPRPLPTVELARDARVRDAGGPWRSARDGEALRLPVDVEVGSSGELVIQHRGSRLLFGAEARGAVGPRADAWPVVMTGGRLAVSMRRGPVRLSTPRGTWVGPSFAVAIAPNAVTAGFEADGELIRSESRVAISAGREVVVTSDGVQGLDDDPPSTRVDAGAEPPAREAEARRPRRGRRADEGDGRRARTAEPAGTDRPEGAANPPPRRRRSERTARPEGPGRPDAGASPEAVAPEEPPPEAPSRARRPTEPPPRLEVDWTRPGRPDKNVLEDVKEEAPAPE